MLSELILPPPVKVTLSLFGVSALSYIEMAGIHVGEVQVVVEIGERMAVPVVCAA